jgi:hypothetical protein
LQATRQYISVKEVVKSRYRIVNERPLNPFFTSFDQNKHTMKTLRYLLVIALALTIQVASAQETPKPKTDNKTKTASAKSTVQPVPAQPVLVIENNDADLGERKEGSDVEYVFVVRNAGGQPLILSEVVRTCGCTEIEWTKEPIAPGKTGTIKIRYDSKRVGPFAKTVIVNSNDPENPQSTLRFKGVIVTQ